MNRKALFKQDVQIVLYALTQQEKIREKSEGYFNMSVANIQALTGFSVGYVHKLLVALQSEHLIRIEHPKARVNLCAILTSNLPDREWFENVTGRSSAISRAQVQAATDSESAGAQVTTDSESAGAQGSTDNFRNSVKCSHGSSYFVRTNTCLSVKNAMQVAKLKTEYKTVRERLAETSK